MGVHVWRAIDENTLQFKVQGRHFNGHVRISYDEGCDLYNIYFGHWRNRKWENIETFDGVYCNQMVDIIDQKVEYIEAYGDR